VNVLARFHNGRPRRGDRNGDPLKDQDRSPAASPRRPSAPCAGDAARASGGHSIALQDQLTLTQRGRLRLPGAGRHTRPSPKGEGPPSRGRPLGLTVSRSQRARRPPRMRHSWWGLIPFVAALVAIRAWWVELADIAGLVTLVCHAHSAANPASSGRPGTRQARRPARPAPTILTRYRRNVTRGIEKRSSWTRVGRRGSEPHQAIDVLHPRGEARPLSRYGQASWADLPGRRSSAAAMARFSRFHRRPLRNAVW